MSITDINARRREEHNREKQRRGLNEDPDNKRIVNDNIIYVREYDHALFLTVVVLVCFGLVMILSSSYYVSLTSEKFENNIFYFFAKQSMATAIGFVALIVAAVINYNFVCKFAPLLYLLACVCLLYVALFGEVTNGAKRWMYIGPFGFQPSEFAKVSMVLLLALYIGKDPRRVNTLRGLAVCALIVALPAGLVMWGKNTSTLIIIVVIAAAMIFVASPHFWRWIALAAGGVTAFMIYLTKFSTGYHAARYAAHLDPFSDPTEAGYQIIQGLYAVASGGLFGLGLGKSNQKLVFMPEPHNDFIFAVICEELGFFGALIVLILFGVFIWRGVRVALKATDVTGMLIATGTTVLVAMQVIINVSVVTNTIVNTGIPLPFISYGGTSVAFILALTGVMLNVSRHHDKAVEDRTNEERERKRTKTETGRATR